jgi:hypothetical protein
VPLDIELGREVSAERDAAGTLTLS